jgi:copper chaperone NosL
LLYGWAAGFVAIAVIGLIDFWKWEYDYGHHLDGEHAIIKIPGMTYQPPLIGAKQLLNFRATSWPSVGGLLAGVAMALAVVAVILAWRERQLALARA